MSTQQFGEDALIPALFDVDAKRNHNARDDDQPQKGADDDGAEPRKQSCWIIVGRAVRSVLGQGQFTGTRWPNSRAVRPARL